MSTEISLYGIAREVLPDTALPTPFVKARIEELGFSSMLGNLSLFADSNHDILRRIPQAEEQGLDQYHLSDPLSFVSHVRENPEWWDSRGYGFDSAIAALEKDIADGHQLVWWFVIEY